MLWAKREPGWSHTLAAVRPIGSTALQQAPKSRPCCERSAARVPTAASVHQYAAAVMNDASSLARKAHMPATSLVDEIRRKEGESACRTPSLSHERSAMATPMPAPACDKSYLASSIIMPDPPLNSPLLGNRLRAGRLPTVPPLEA